MSTTIELGLKKHPVHYTQGVFSMFPILRFMGLSPQRLAPLL